ncbi:aromatic amino acid lyase, partial [Rhizobium ruizarguesonis]
LRARLQGSGLVAAAFGRRTQDALSLRSVPHAHGAARYVFDNYARIADQELASVTDNPDVSGTPEHPIVSSEAHAVAPELGQAA